MPRDHRSVITAEPPASAETRPVRILRALADAPAGLDTPALLAILGEGITPRGTALSWYGTTLRRLARNGEAEIAGKTTDVGWQRCPRIIWRITEAGRDRLTRHDAAPQLAAEAQAEAQRLAEAKAQAAAARAGALAETVRVHGRGASVDERRAAGARLRGLGCTLEEIGQVFGVSGEQVRQDLLSHAPWPPRPVRLRGQRLSDAIVLEGVLIVRMGQRTAYFTHAEAMQIKKVIDEWDSAGDSPLGGAHAS